MPGLAPRHPEVELSTAERTRYARHIILPEIGLEGQRRLKASRVLVVGAGGLGSVTATYLAAAGVGTVGIVDDDVVEESNLQRQVVHGSSDVGRRKTESAADRLSEVNPHVEVVRHDVRLRADNALEILADYDVVVDGCDTFVTRYLVGDACALLGLPHVWGSIHRFDGQVSVWFAGEGPCYRCVFPSPPPAGTVPSCAEAGVLGSLCASVGSVQSTEAVKLLLGIGEPLVGRLLVHDALRQSWDTIGVRRDPGCALCGDSPSVTRLEDLDAWCGMPSTSPDEPAAEVPTVTARELAARLEARARGEEDFVLVDVRGSGERSVVSIPGAEAIELEEFRSGRAAGRLPAGIPVVLHCKAGGRSLEAARSLVDQGRADVSHLEGGVLAWVHDVDPSLPTY